MNEEDARRWIEDRFGQTAGTRVAHFLDLVAAESLQQNLIAPSTISQIWARHAVDSAQLVALAPANGVWIDIGTGGGFPGMIVAILRPGEMVLVEPRRRRADFLARSAAMLGVDVQVSTAKIEAVQASGMVISARAVAPVDKLLLAARHCAVRNTRWLLPRGQLAVDEIADLQCHWDGTFHVEQSVTADSSSILIIDGVRRR